MIKSTPSKKITRKRNLIVVATELMALLPKSANSIMIHYFAIGLDCIEDANVLVDGKRYLVSMDQPDDRHASGTMFVTYNLPAFE